MFGDKGFFGGLFDFNGDGKLDGFERAADFAMFMEVTKEDEDADDASDDDGIRVSAGCSANTTDDDDFEETGYSLDELSFMDDDERAEIFDAAGLDVDDYDF